MRQGAHRVGFRIAPHCGRERIMAHVDRGGAPRVGRYGVDVQAIDRAAQELLALDPQIEIYLVDEIGKMECHSDEFVRHMRALFDSEKTIVATLGHNTHGFMAAVRHRSDAQRWEVTRSNRETMVERVLAWLRMTPARNPTGR